MLNLKKNNKNKNSEEVQKMLSDLNEGFERPSPELKKN